MRLDDFIHPEDKEALDHLKALPYVSTVLKTIMKYYDERITYEYNMASKIRLGPNQMPEIYNLLPPICEKIGIPEPEFYLETDPNPNAYAMGENRPNITLNWGIIDLMTRDELKAVVAHECGHILCHHMFYMTLSYYILDYINGGLIRKNTDMNILSSFNEAVMIALLYWSRKSELSADRVAAYVTSPETALAMIGRIAGSHKRITPNFNLDEYAKQALEYDKIRLDNLWDMTLSTYITLDQSHPFQAVRARELMKWTRTEQYINLKAGIPMCPSCHRTIDDNWNFCRYCGHKL